MLLSQDNHKQRNKSGIEYNVFAGAPCALSLFKEGSVSERATACCLSGHEFFDGFVEYACSEHKVFDTYAFIYAVFQLDYFA
jgi:hypothetical protein